MSDWIEWNGGECPVPAGTVVDICIGIGKPFATGLAQFWDWRRTDQIKWWRPTARETRSTPQEAYEAAYKTLTDEQNRLQYEHDTKRVEINRLQERLDVLGDRIKALKGIFND